MTWRILNDGAFTVEMAAVHVGCPVRGSIYVYGAGPTMARKVRKRTLR